MIALKKDITNANKSIRISTIRISYRHRIMQIE